MTQKPTKHELVGFINMVPYSILTIIFRLIHLVSYLPGPIAGRLLWLISMPLYLLREIKRGMMA